MIARAYAHALVGVQAGRDAEARERLAERFFETLARKGHKKLLPAILKEMECIGKQKEGKERGVVAVASANDTKRYASEIEELSQKNALSEKPDVIVDDKIVGGYRFEKGHVVHDATHRRFLIDLYRNIIT